MPLTQLIYASRPSNCVRLGLSTLHGELSR